MSTCKAGAIRRQIREQWDRLSSECPMRFPAFVMIRRDLRPEVLCIDSAYIRPDLGVERVECLDIRWMVGGPDVRVIPEGWQGFAQGQVRPAGCRGVA